jgi:hypothetical protein
MENKISVAELKTPKSHSHPAFNISREENKGSVLDDHFQVRIEEFEDKVQIRFRRENVQQLYIRVENGPGNNWFRKSCMPR